MVLEGIFGNKTAVLVLLFLYHYGEGYASLIAKVMKCSVTPAVKQLDRFEREGLLISKVVGRSRVYQFNSLYRFHDSMQKLLSDAYHSIPHEERKELFNKRLRPRRKGKVALNG